ncbi:alpha-1,2-fucosyltransferase [Chitinophaga sp. YIM B06452]|uniref:alpha-1,2-fucosyltransferase n=1 Tax=Chitinophaga sp. YIM B06452 TaxID=3082158 RepID=UPI0031FE7344
MIIVNVSGGIGNQMFQYAFGRYLSILLKKDLFLNKTIYQFNQYRAFGLDSFHLPPNCFVGNFNDLMNNGMIGEDILLIEEKFFHFDEELVAGFKELVSENELPQRTAFVISGYWQSAKYFEGIKEMIQADFNFRHKLEGAALVMQNRIKSENAVMVHVRRGDYLTCPGLFGTVSKEYIIGSIQYCIEKLEAPVFYIFSDDVLWCRENLKEIEGLTFIDDSFYDEPSKSYLQLMSSCKHFIISNSTYSWWASWLGSSKGNLTIAPNEWFTDQTRDTKDIYGPEWIKL